MSLIDVDQLLREFREALSTANLEVGLLEKLRQKYIGKKSVIKLSFRELRHAPPEKRKALASLLNATQDTITKEFNAQLELAQKREIEQKLEAEWLDLTMPGTTQKRGARHPLTEVERRCLAVLRQLGFQLVDGPEVDNAFHNFDALNIPAHHPARDMQDTFWVTGGLLLRSHTTTVHVVSI